MKQVILSLLFGLFFLTFQATAQSPTVFMEVEGNTQGNITRVAGTADSAGSLWVEDREDESLVFAMEFTSQFDLDPSTGAITGEALPCVLKVKKIVDAASPRLFQALASKEDVEVTLNYYRTNSSDVQENYYQVKFKNAKVAAFRMLSQETPLTVGANEARDFEEITFTYTRIELAHFIAGTSAVYDY
ncbi:MAG: type VI secretion system tube protein TssD [Bacteroidota bacterium]